MNRRCATLAVACLVVVQAGARAAEARQPRDPFARGTVSIEFAAGLFGELWHLNERRETIGEGAVSTWGAVAEDVSIGVEFHHLRVIQRGSDAFVQGISPLVRWRFIDRNPWSVFAEIGPGVSWSDVPTPPRGTKFNYLFQGSVGFLRNLGGNSRASFGLRLLHLSNNEREGVDRNPDFEISARLPALPFPSSFPRNGPRFWPIPRIRLHPRRQQIDRLRVLHDGADWRHL